MFYGTPVGVTELMLMLRSLTYSEVPIGTTEITERILVLRNLFLCESTRRYAKSELIIIVSHTGSDQTYTDTYQVWTLVHDRY